MRAFFANNDEKYKFRERRKWRPISDTFFNHLESQDQEKMLDRKRLQFKGDKVEKLLKDFILGEVDFFTLFSDHTYRRCKSDNEDNWGTNNHQRAACVCPIKVDNDYRLVFSLFFAKLKQI